MRETKIGKEKLLFSSRLKIHSNWNFSVYTVNSADYSSTFIWAEAIEPAHDRQWIRHRNQQASKKIENCYWLLVYKILLLTMKALLLNLAKSHLNHTLKVILKELWSLESKFTVSLEHISKQDYFK